MKIGFDTLEDNLLMSNKSDAAIPILVIFSKLQLME